MYKNGIVFVGIALAGLFGFADSAHAQPQSLRIKVTVTELNGNQITDAITVTAQDGDGVGLKISAFSGGGTNNGEYQVTGTNTGFFDILVTPASSFSATLTFTRGASTRALGNLDLQNARTDNVTITIGPR